MSASSLPAADAEKSAGNLETNCSKTLSGIVRRREAERWPCAGDNETAKKRIAAAEWR